MKNIILNLPDGRIAYARPCAEALPGESEDQYLARVAAMTVAKLPGATVNGYVDDEVIPNDALSWKYRDAWRHVDGRIAIDVDAAKPIALAALRKKRDKELADLDVEEMRFAKDAVRLDAVRERKQVLRDAPTALAQTIAAAKTVTELEEVSLP